MTKAEELLKALGLEVPAEDADIKVIVSEYTAKQIEDIKATIDNSEVIAKAKEEGGIVAEKRIKRSLNSKFGLGLTNSNIDSTDIDKFGDALAEKVKGSASEDVDKLNERIIELTNEVNKKDEEWEGKLNQSVTEWKSKWKAEKVNQALTQTLSPIELTIDPQRALKQLRFEAAEAGLQFDVDESGAVVIKNGETKAMKPDNTGHETLESFADRSLDHFKKKSNGAGGEQHQQAAGTTEIELPEDVRAQMQKMREQQGVVAV